MSVPAIRPFVLRGAHVMDPSGGFEGPLDVVVVEGRVAEVGRGARAPEGADEHDFEGLWVMPGVFDCHDHVAFSTTDELEAMRTPLTQWAFEAAVNMRRTLEAGVTFVRDAYGADAGMRESVSRGYIAGPRLQISLNLLSQTGGHGDDFFEGPGLEWGLMPKLPGHPPKIVDGVDEMRRAVRQLLRARVDWIKLCATGGVVSPYDAPDEPQFSEDEIRTAVVEAARKGKFVMTHANGGEGLDNAVRAGVRSIEHGLFLTEEAASKMAAAGCWLVPTLAILRDIVRWADESRASKTHGLLPAYAVDKAIAVKDLIGEAVRVAKAAGVRIALGTDFINRAQHGRNLEELALMRDAGMGVEETLLAATAGGAELCGVADYLGRILPGFLFDAIVLDWDPTDISGFGRPGAVSGVFKGGVPIVAHPRLGQAPALAAASAS
jgi:imidazolonepropionase-like amidohydrolase